MDEGASQVGEFSLTDKRFSRISKFMAEILFDENVGGENGNCHIAIGASFPDSYGGKEENTKELRDKLGFNDSSLHWDLINTEQKTVTAYLKDGSEVVIYKDGVFLYDRISE
jgi:aminopeptidase